MGNTVLGVYNEIKSRLAASGVEDYGFEARVIMRFATGYDNKKIMINYNSPLSPAQMLKINDIVARRQARYPLQYILGEWEFYGLRFKVGDGVLVPRADTEVAVDTALELIKNINAPRVLDLCAGSGAIGVSIAVNRADSEVTLLEKYEAAAKYLAENIKLNRAENARYMPGDVLSGDGGDNKFDLIISNPPYIKGDEMKTLQPEVKFEPASALDGGEDGLDFYRAIIKNYTGSLNRGGFMCFEVGANQAKSVKVLLEKAGFTDIGVKKDLAGIDRVVFGTVRQV